MSAPSSQRQDVSGTFDPIGILVAVLDSLIAVGRQALRPHVRRTARWVAWRIFGLSTAVLAAAWAAVGLTLALHQAVPLWAAFLGVSGILALGAAIALSVSPGEDTRPTQEGQIKKE